jgi:hypothetical protein
MKCVEKKSLTKTWQPIDASDHPLPPPWRMPAHPLFAAVYPWKKTDRVPISNPFPPGPSPKPTGGSGWMPCLWEGPRGNLFLANCSPLGRTRASILVSCLLEIGGEAAGQILPVSSPPCCGRSSTAGTVLYPVVGGQPDDVDITGAVTNGRATRKKGGEATNTVSRHSCPASLPL